MTFAPPRALAVFFVLAGLVVAANSRTIGGGFVYDDQILPGHPMLDGWEDVVAAFAHTSEDYLSYAVAAPASAPHGVTYRPLPMISLAAVNAVFGPVPWAHHALSLAFHILVLALLVRYAERGGRVSWPATFALGIFAAHPALVEAYGWINGRSDVMAAVPLVGLALVARRREASGPRTALALLLILVGMLCKETFLVAAAAVLATYAFDVSDGRVRFDRRVAPFVLVYVLSVWVFIVLRTSLLPHGVKSAGIPLGALGNELRVVALGVETLLLPFPRPMRLLAWEVSRPWSVEDVFALVVVAGSFGTLLARRRFRAAALVVGAVATLLPASLVSDGFWLGFDRYLYMPACLLVLAAVPIATLSRTPLSRAAVGSILVAVLLVETATAGKTYASQRAFYGTMIAARPSDPTGYLVGINSASLEGDLGTARELVTALPARDLPPVLLHRAILAELSMARVDEAARLVEDASRRFPEDSRFVLDLLRVRGEQNRWADVVAQTELVLRDHPERRPAAASAVRRWLATGRVPAEWRAELRDLIRRASAVPNRAPTN